MGPTAWRKFLAGSGKGQVHLETAHEAVDHKAVVAMPNAESAVAHDHEEHEDIL